MLPARKGGRIGGPSRGSSIGGASRGGKVGIGPKSGKNAGRPQSKKTERAASRDDPENRGREIQALLQERRTQVASVGIWGRSIRAKRRKSTSGRFNSSSIAGNGEQSRLRLATSDRDRRGTLSRWKGSASMRFRNLPRLLHMVLESSPRVVVSSLAIRFFAALLPLAILGITRFVIDSISRMTSLHEPLPARFWWMVLLEFSLACLGMILARLIDLLDAIFADRFAGYIDTRIMDHASRLDLASFEDAHFHDKLERARAQGTQRIGMIQAVGKMIQQLITAVTLMASIWLFSPWIVLVLFICLIPGFIGETHFAFLSYSLNYDQTNARREMDYLRLVGASRESIKELKLFQLRPLLIGRYSALANETHRQTAGLARRRMLFGSLLTLLGAAGSTMPPMLWQSTGP